jgi:hypothetical protein
MKRKYYNILFVALFTLIFSTSCKEIRDLLKAIDKYGYKSSIPLSKKELPVEKLLLGSFVYNDLPIIISEKDATTYIIKFLSTELDGTDIEVEAFLSKIGNSKYLNLDLGYSYSFLKISDVSISRDVNVKLLRNTIDQYVTEKNLVSWLVKNGDDDEFINKDSLEVDIFYNFNFTRISQERAYQIKAEQLKEKKEQLFNSCKDYETYKFLSAKYPGDALLANAREGIFKNCKSISDYQDFVLFFPNDIFTEKAKEIIAQKVLYEKDSVDYSLARSKNEIDAYISFIDKCTTQKFKDSASAKLTPLIGKITEDYIEWKWNGDDRKEAIKLIFFKIDYNGKYLKTGWYNEHLTRYCLKMQQAEMKEQGIKYIDKMALNNVTKDELLDLYISKGFLFWSLEKYDQSLEVFRSKINEEYNNNESLTFKSSIKEKYKKYQKEGIKFPDEKAMWKKIKNLK